MKKILTLALIVFSLSPSYSETFPIASLNDSYENEIFSLKFTNSNLDITFGQEEQLVELSSTSMIEFVQVISAESEILLYLPVSSKNLVLYLDDYKSADYNIILFTQDRILTGDFTKK